MKLQPFAFMMLVAAIAPRAAEAHFLLLEPASWSEQNAYGDPQKAEPCGGENGTLTGAVTRFRVGETITVRWQETIYHPGHWRIALAADRNDLVDPAVMLDSNQVSIGAEIQDPPMPPVLLDNLFPRTSLNGPTGTVFEQEITLPMTPCARCTLQVIQFMLAHGPPFYIYHHCADIEIVDDAAPDAGVPGDAGMEMDGAVAIDGGDPTDAAVPFDAGQTPVDAGNAGPTDGGTSAVSDAGDEASTEGGCGCSASPRGNVGGASAFLLLFAALVVRWLRRSHRNFPARSESMGACAPSSQSRS